MCHGRDPRRAVGNAAAARPRVNRVTIPPTKLGDARATAAVIVERKDQLAGGVQSIAGSPWIDSPPSTAMHCPVM
jgi:hypothetical protein